MPVLRRFGTRLMVATWFVLASVGAKAEEPCTLGAHSLLAYGLDQGKTGAPFTATIRTTYDQPLRDGNAIHGMNLAHVARDSAGRSRVEMAVGCERGLDDQLQNRLNVTVYDPVTKTTLSWTIGNTSPKIVQVSRSKTIAPKKQLTPEELAERLKLQKLNQRHDETHTENLGTRSFDGVLAEGTRTTATFPAGEEGNDLPLTTKAEFWSSRALGAIVMQIADDPRSGVSKLELEDINLTEPDPSLFTPPEGYKMDDPNPKEPALSQTR